HPQAGLGHAAQAGDDLLLAGVVVLQGHVDHTLGAVVHQLESLDVALVQQDLGNGLLHVGSGDVDGVMLGVVRVADTGEHIRNGIGNVHRVIPPIRLQAGPVSAARYRVSPEPTYCRWLGTGPRRRGDKTMGKPTGRLAHPVRLYHTTYQEAFRTPGIWPL